MTILVTLFPHEALCKTYKAKPLTTTLWQLAEDLTFAPVAGTVQCSKGQLRLEHVEVRYAYTKEEQASCPVDPTPHLTSAGW